ncbi:Eco57I restriction-modification methylase domain-containing protein [Geodermatophilus nigrescens]|uniref:site-specific DNA-methyltransferase (adenine-specific) n=1 Tax=Geodermatophilus nigrescens TaxID=1070870 RepID=A0A1M5JQA8_9ACTN|nr:hypothetical protein [Geodermatophilus nigrescens]SHG42595.1 hypothetical protein SAMN05444351_2601 [Geodermatophilus nigrescens]
MSNSTHRTRRGRRPSSTDWLQILDIDGPFLAAPVVTDTWPDGLPALDQARMDALRTSNSLYDANPGARDGFIRHILVDTLDWRHNLAWGPDAAAFAVAVPEHQTRVDITFAMQAQDDTGVVTPGAALLLGIVLPPKTATTGRAPVGGGTWTAGPADRLAHALRVRGVPLGLVTNGDTWTLVSVSDGGAVSTATWTRHAWLEEPQTLRAFVALLTRARFLGVAADQTLPALLTASLARQEEVTERLAEQSQAVVEMLVATLGRLDATHLAEHGARLLPGNVGPAEVYQASVTVLMRLVFLLYAEERGLLPLDDDTYAGGYAVTTLAESLRERATDHGEDALERTATGWYRLLSLFRGVHRGARHEQLILPAYGGSLFDPDRFPWLEGRASATEPLGRNRVPAIDDRTLLRALDALQTLQFAKERRRVSYRSLDVEQIGYVYEGLLDQDARTAEDWVVSIAVSDKDLRKNGPEIYLTDLEVQQAKGDDALAAWLVDQIKNAGGNRSKASILKALTSPTGDDAQRFARLVREACGNDDTATARVMPYCRLLRMDPRDLPVVYPPGSLYLTDSSARANTGAIYTPRFLAERVVETTLEGLVYKPGPLDTEDKSAWVLRTPKEILDLRICDIAAGSGAFLVAATRYLANRLVEARRQHGSQSKVPDADEPATVSFGARALEEQELLDARREVIDHCIYGVDINPMAVEMAKLSLWLVTLDPRRPFSFLDDRLAIGDSLLGITSPDQLRDLHFDPKKGRALHENALDLYTSKTDELMKAASELRWQIAEIDLHDARDAEYKKRLLHRSEQLTRRLALIADALSGAVVAGASESDFLKVAMLANDANDGSNYGDEKLRESVVAVLGGTTGAQNRPAHFPLLFPEVFTDGRSGFDAIVGNPPFLGNRHWRAAFGPDFQALAARLLAARSIGKIDLAALFLRRACTILGEQGSVGLILTTSLREPQARPHTYEALTSDGLEIFAAEPEIPWPTSSVGIHVSLVWLTRAAVFVSRRLGGRNVDRIPASLSEEVESLTPEPLSWLFAFEGSHNGKGESFLVDASDSQLPALRDEAPDLWVPYLTADDIAGSLVLHPRRYCFYAGDQSLHAVCAGRPLTERFLHEVVRPQRSPDALKSYPGLIDRWWQMVRTRYALRQQLGAIAPTYIAMPAVSKYAIAARVPATWLANNGVRLIADHGDWLFAFMHSQWFESWVWRFSGRRETRINLAVTGAIHTLPKLRLSDDWAGTWLQDWEEAVRAAARSGKGLTDFWNNFHSNIDAPPLNRCRRLRGVLDRRIAEENDLPDLSSASTVIDVGPRFGWDTASREVAVQHMYRLHLEQRALLTETPRRQRPTAVAGLGQMQFGDGA